jgi:DNA-binding IclR family transcriptional regulator
MPPTRKGDRSGAEGQQDPLYVTALARGLAVLRCCAENGGDLTVSEIAKRLDLPQATVWRSCYTMLKLGYLVRTQGERLRPGLAVLSLGHAALSRQPLAELARPGMEAIARQFPGAVSLGVPQGLEMLYIARVEGGAPIYPGLRAGSRVGVLASAMGWAYLAALPEKDRDAFLAVAKARQKEQYERIAQQLKQAIRHFERTGFLLNSGVIHPELNAIAFPIRLDAHTPVASISFGGVLAEFPPERLLNEVAPQLSQLASALSSSIRHGTTVA